MTESKWVVRRGGRRRRKMRRRRRRKQVRGDLRNRSFWKLKEEAEDKKKWKIYLLKVQGPTNTHNDDDE